MECDEGEQTFLIEVKYMKHFSFDYLIVINQVFVKNLCIVISSIS